MTRARRMPPEERRAAIISAARSLLPEHGINFTTRQAAEAAGIAEGTIFRFFPTLASLHDALLDDLMDTGTTQYALSRIDRLDPFEERIAAVIETLQRHGRETHVLTALTRTGDAAGKHQKCRAARFQEASSALIKAIELILAPDASLLKLPLSQAAAALHVAAVMSVHPLLEIDYPTDPALLADLYCHGMAQEPKE